MNQKEIKDECFSMYLQIKKAEVRLKELRSICKHPDTFKGNYSYRIGAVYPATICSDCGEPIKVELETLKEKE